MANHKERRYLAYCTFKNDIADIMRRVETSARLGLLPSDVLDEDEVTVIRSLGCTSDEIMSVLHHHYDSEVLPLSVSSGLKEYIDGLLPPIIVPLPLECVVPDHSIPLEDVVDISTLEYVDDVSELCEDSYLLSFPDGARFRDGRVEKSIPITHLNPNLIDFPECSAISVENGSPVMTILYLDMFGKERFYHLGLFDLIRILCDCDCHSNSGYLELPDYALRYSWEFHGLPKDRGLSGIIDNLFKTCSIKQLSSLYIVSVCYPYAFLGTSLDLTVLEFKNAFAEMLVRKISNVAGIAALKDGLPGFLRCATGSLSYVSRKVAGSHALYYWFHQHRLSYRLCTLLIHHLWEIG